MSKLSARALSISRDGYMAGPDQDVKNPLGVGGERLHEWIFATKSGRVMIGDTGGSEGVDDRLFGGSFESVGATIMGRNMFGPLRGPWASDDWRGWWGETPPFHHCVFVLTHFARSSFTLGDTTFHFVTGGADDALSRALDSANGKDVRLGGGVATLREFLDAQLLDELHVAVVPIELGSGERLLDREGAWPRGYECRTVVEGERATHYELAKIES